MNKLLHELLPSPADERLPLRSLQMLFDLVGVLAAKHYAFTLERSIEKMAGSESTVHEINSPTVGWTEAVEKLARREAWDHYECIVMAKKLIAVYNDALPSNVETFSIIQESDAKGGVFSPRVVDRATEINVLVMQLTERLRDLDIPADDFALVTDLRIKCLALISHVKSI